MLGAVLVANALALRRWLSTGQGGERYGFTSAQLLDTDRATLSLPGTASVISQQGIAPQVESPRAEPSASEFGGGRSGGGGGGDNF